MIAATGHDLESHAAVSATCTEAGNSAYWYCKNCHKYFSNAAATNEIAENSWVIAALGHNLSFSATGNVLTVRCTRTGCTTSATATITATNATYTGTAITTASVAYDPDNTLFGGDLTIGYTNNTNIGTAIASITKGGATATVSFTISAPEHVHNIVQVTAKDPTCTEVGWNAYEYCTLCEYTTYSEIPALGHNLQFNAAGAVLTASCQREGCSASATATISVPNATETYTGSAIEPATVAYDPDNTLFDGDLTITYSDNVNVGTAKASITKGAATAEVTFAIAKAAFNPDDYTLDNLDQTTNDPKDVTTKTNDSTATFDPVEYEVPLTEEELETAAPGVTTKWTTERPTEAGTYRVRAKLTGSNNVTLPAGDTYVYGDLTISRSGGGHYSTTPTNTEHVHNLSHIPAKEATEAEEGNKEYWYCAACQKYFSDAAAKNETTKEALTIPKLGAPEKLHFDDVKDNDWFHDSVYGVAEKGIMVGTAKNLFSPNANTTRAMMMTILARLDGVNTEGGATWYEKGLKWAMDNKVSDGTNPEMNITREQVVTMLYRFAKSPAATGELKFTDSDTVSSWALDAMKWAVANKIVEGMSNNMLKPQGLATRAQMAAILERYSKLGK